jgi:hypothetical protein
MLPWGISVSFLVAAALFWTCFSTKNGKNMSSIKKGKEGENAFYECVFLG